MYQCLGRFGQRTAKHITISATQWEVLSAGCRWCWRADQRPDDRATKAEVELTAAYRLLDELAHDYHHAFDVVVMDGLYFKRPVLAAIRRHGWEAVIWLKDERLTLWQDAVGLLVCAAPVAGRTTRRETRHRLGGDGRPVGHGGRAADRPPDADPVSTVGSSGAAPARLPRVRHADDAG